MNNNWFDFRDDEEREMFFVAIPVILFFALLGYWLMKDDVPSAVGQPVTVAAAVADSDGDGVTDASDRCVSVAGDVALYGCPENVAWADKDNDTDGIRNGIDECPETLGVAANNGCAAVLSNVAEEEPAKEKLAEIQPVETKPIIAADTDADGIPDASDACPSVAGAETNKGCPADTDTDGIIDTDDQCPDVAGPAGSNGCPADKDSDGVFDTADRCPDHAGTAELAGCPADTDGDGVHDLLDNCPAVAANEADGCPVQTVPVDTDADGLADGEDRCPTEAGPEDTNGCPSDQDNDGIIDSNDSCPQQAGSESNQGCPEDSDGDGFIDSEDNCPEVAGSDTGCPVESIEDLDRDGVADADDNCPGLIGVADNFGCPADSDGDGIDDINDKCPSTFGESSLEGCPTETAMPSGAIEEFTQENIEVSEVLNAAISGVKFNSSSAVLTERSREILVTVADLMKKYPDTILEIRGHTDSSGNSERNLQLSLDRAQSCATFIASQGVSNDRLRALGFGDTVPLADNATVAGRESNRRVEFLLVEQ